MVSVKEVSAASGRDVSHITRNNHVIKNTDYTAVYEKNKRIGLKGEQWVLYFEKMRLRKLGISHDVEHSSVVKGDGWGYDILSVEDDGVTERYIEVKTTVENEETPFFFTEKELQFSQQHHEHYYLYRVYDYDDETKSASIVIRQGGLDGLAVWPVSYSAVL